MNWPIWLFIILGIIATAFAVVVIIDRSILIGKLNSIEAGMTGQEVIEKTKLNLSIRSVDKKTNGYRAEVKSGLKMFRYELTFVKGRYITRQRLTRKG